MKYLEKTKLDNPLGAKLNYFFTSKATYLNLGLKSTKAWIFGILFDFLVVLFEISFKFDSGPFFSNSFLFDPERYMLYQVDPLKKARKILRSSFIRCDENPGRWFRQSNYNWWFWNFQKNYTRRGKWHVTKELSLFPRSWF